MHVNDRGHTLNVAIVGGLYALSSYHLLDAQSHPASYPGIAEDFAHEFAVLNQLPVDIFLGAHGIYFNMQEKLHRFPKEGATVWVDPAGYRQVVAEAQAEFEQRLTRERKRDRLLPNSALPAHP